MQRARIEEENRRQLDRQREFEADQLVFLELGLLASAGHARTMPHRRQKRKLRLC